MGAVIKAIGYAWGVPLILCIIAIMFRIDTDDVKEESFVPIKTEVIKKRGTQFSDHFELWIHSTNGSTYFHRDPNPEPIEKLYEHIPDQETIKIKYTETFEGNMLLEIAFVDEGLSPILAFDEVIQEFNFRSRMIYIVAAIWFVLFNFLILLVWKTDRASPVQPT